LSLRKFSKNSLDMVREESVDSEPNLSLVEFESDRNGENEKLKKLLAYLDRKNAKVLEMEKIGHTKDFQIENLEKDVLDLKKRILEKFGLEGAHGADGSDGNLENKKAEVSVLKMNLETKNRNMTDLFEKLDKKN
jgi:hypothetical protein